MGPEEGAQPSVIKMMEKVGTEVRVEEMAVGDKSGKKKDRSPVLAVDLELQEEQTGESPPGPMGNNNHAPGILQTLRVEDEEGDCQALSYGRDDYEVSGGDQKGFLGIQGKSGQHKRGVRDIETKFDLMAKRTQLLEETVESLKEDVVQIKQDLRASRACEQDLQDKLERIENVARRNNLRILSIPEGLEGNDVKAYCASLIRNSLQLEETKREIATDIQRIHRDPFRRDPGRKKPRKVLINFLTYALKEKILSQALKQKTLRGNDFSFEVRSDLASSTLDRQWELGNRIEDFKKLSASAQLKFPAILRVMYNNKMYNLRDIKAADDLLETIRSGSS
ncbi:hypothetical protein NDU88_001004 [Pleurodeles waltl]|uniref:L1 transposable element RRM domain-containing protein n=1 Tax=Pleurodeles waltl TaxID=8319 RepID=A0AAV7NEG7_PLEWA|nr:hypothetical protein NDU88_001004 [Pleurodeles waltl]